MFSKSIFIATAAVLAPFVTAQDSMGYVLPTSGTASTTQFLLGPELQSGTACGMNSINGANNIPGGAIGQGGGPGMLYAAINQLAFGANPGAGAGGPGGACGVCYQLTPVDGSGNALSANALTFMIIDECPADATNGANCGQCSLGSTNVFGQNWHFDIAVDAMSQAQYNQFFAGVTDGDDWNEVQFQQVACDVDANPIPETASWGCVLGCENNDSQAVCAGGATK